MEKNTKTSGKIGVILAIVVLALVALTIIFLRKENVPEPTPINTNEGYTPPAGWVLSHAEGRTFYYPEQIGTNFIQTTDWPPALQILEEEFSCTPAGEEAAQAGRTELLTIKNNQYCRTTRLEGAAGSTYGLYAYAFTPQDATTTAILTFGLRFPQCANYDEPRRSECQNENNTFEIDSIVDNIARSLRLAGQ